MKYYILFILLFFTSCSTTNTTLDMEFNKVTFINKTNMEILDVVVYSQNTSKKMSCSLIPKNGHCSYKFKSKIQNNNNIIVTWKYKEKEYKYKHIIKDINNSKPIVITINILNNGLVSISKL